MRHPGAVVESQLRSRWDARNVFDKYLADQALMEGLLHSQAPFLRRELNRVETLAAKWCIENVVPAMQVPSIGHTIVFYEDLLDNRETEWRRLATTLGLDTLPDHRLQAQPSQTASRRRTKKGVVDDRYKQIHGLWHQRLNANDLADIQAVLDAFEVGFYEVASPRPNVGAFAKQYGAREVAT
jgi:hypothetical protein